MTKGVLTVISGFSGAGKGTCMKRLMQKYDNYALSVSMTTRAPREGEENGVAYFFVDKKTFEERIEKGQMIEYATYCDNYYGTPKDYVEQKLAEGKDVILEIEIQGALQVKKLFPDCLLLFITPPSGAELIRRLEGRGTETAEVIKKRMARAVVESEGLDAYDYIVINDVLEDCVEEINTLVGLHRHISSRQKDLINDIRAELEEFSKGAE